MYSQEEATTRNRRQIMYSKMTTTRARRKTSFFFATRDEATRKAREGWGSEADGVVRGATRQTSAGQLVGYQDIMAGRVVADIKPCTALILHRREETPDQEHRQVRGHRWYTRGRRCHKTHYGEKELRYTPWENGTRKPTRNYMTTGHTMEGYYSDIYKRW